MAIIPTDAAPLSLIIALAISYLLVVTIRRHKDQRCSPPGPKPIPLFGNLFQLPRQQEWLQFSIWAKEYGDVLTINVFNKPMIVLNSAKSIRELFEGRSAIYSNRPHLVMASELMGWGETVVLMTYGERFKNYRRLLKFGLNSQVSKEYWTLMEREVACSLTRLLENPEEFVQNLRLTVGTVALKIAYGYNGKSDNFKLMKDTEEALKLFAIAALPGVFLVDTLPFLKYLPTWFPGAQFRKLGIKTQKLVKAIVDVPFANVKEQMNSGIAPKSFTADLLSESIQSRSSDGDIKWVSSALYTGQLDTTVAAMSTFYLCMMLFPEVQAKAQNEIDRVIGNDRLPSIQDRENLPYVQSVLKEVLRWKPVVSMVSHSVTQDDVYDGFFIPAGTALVANIWATLHDESVYKAPDVFRPERFLPPDSEPDSSSFAFGFGRRACPGESVAQASLFATVACTLATFNISKPYDSNGKEIEPVLLWSSGVTSHPYPFKCQILPRSSTALEVIKNSQRQES